MKDQIIGFLERMMLAVYCVMFVLLLLPEAKAQGVDNYRTETEVIHTMCKDMAYFSIVFARMKYTGIPFKDVEDNIVGPNGEKLGQLRGMALGVATAIYEMFPSKLPDGKSLTKALQELKDGVYITCYTDGLQSIVKERS